jgi:hypothetical protein
MHRPGIRNSPVGALLQQRVSGHVAVQAPQSRSGFSVFDRWKAPRGLAILASMPSSRRFALKKATRSLRKDLSPRRPSTVQARQKPEAATEAVDPLNRSPRMLAQRQQMADQFGAALQRQPDVAEEGSTVQMYRGTRGTVFQNWVFRTAGFVDGVATGASALAPGYFVDGADTDAITQQFVDAATAGLVQFVDANLDAGLEQDQVVGAITVEMATIADGWAVKKPPYLRDQATRALQSIQRAVHAALDSTDAPTRNLML